MVNHKKTIEKIKAESVNITYTEAESLLEWLGYTKLNKGKTSGSRVKFIKGNKPIYLHKPHARKNLLKYQVKDLKSNLRGEI